MLDLPQDVLEKLDDEDVDVFKATVEQNLARGKSEAVAFAAAWAAVEAGGGSKDENRKGGGSKDEDEEEMKKRQVNDDLFTEELEAIARSADLGFGGFFHGVEVEGQKFFRPGRNAEEYMAGVGELEDEPEKVSMFERLIGALMDYAVSKRDNTFQSMVPVLKVDKEQRIVWGWASVSTLKGELVVDHHGHQIEPHEMEAAANEFMLSVRTAKAMHKGSKVGEVIHSFPLTKELGEALGVSSDKEGWIIAMKIHDDETWEKVKTGEFGAFSIGGMGELHAS